MLTAHTSKGQTSPPTPADAPAYTATGDLKRPQNYREWIFLTAGIDMSYTTDAAVTGHSTFQNVFVNPTAYRAFLQTGTWPEKTMLILETRPGPREQAPLNKRGHTQSANIAGLEVHVKDASHREGGWGFFAFTKPDTAKLIKHVPQTATSVTKTTPPSTQPSCSSTPPFSHSRVQTHPKPCLHKRNGRRHSHPEINGCSRGHEISANV